MEIDKEAFLFDAEAKLRQWNTTIAGLEPRRRGETGGKSPLSQRIESLVQRRNTLENKIEKLRQCAGGGWREVSREVEEAVEEVQEAWTCIASTLSQMGSAGEELAAGSSPLPAEVN